VPREAINPENNLQIETVNGNKGCPERQMNPENNIDSFIWMGRTPSQKLWPTTKGVVPLQRVATEIPIDANKPLAATTTVHIVKGCAGIWIPCVHSG